MFSRNILVHLCFPVNAKFTLHDLASCKSLVAFTRYITVLHLGVSRYTVQQQLDSPKNLSSLENYIFKMKIKMRSNKGFNDTTSKIRHQHLAN